jgi:dTDP-4-amino-4,6-dideoxygalactose transaminase
MLPMKRREFVALSAAAVSARGNTAEKPALSGGKPVRTQPFPAWPQIETGELTALKQVLESGRWNRNGGSFAARFEQEWARALGAKHCLAAANGTTSLFTALNALGIGPGDEVIVPPYTFIATVNVVLLQHALPIFVDTDPETFQIDARKLESAITPKTACIMPVHLGGAAADMDAILTVAAKHKIPVIEDACQAHFGEWRNRKLSTLGDLGCFSFQASKNLNSGEGGAVISNDDRLMERCRAFHNNGRASGLSSFEYTGNGCNLRITEFQAAILTEQLKRLEAQSRVRERNAAYLTAQLKEIPGITPARMYEGCTRNAYHLYMFRYNAEAFENLPRTKFLKALAAEGIPCSPGYRPLNREPFLEHTFAARGWKRIYPGPEMKQWRERNSCPANDRLCTEAVWFTQTMLLGTKADMDQIVEAIRKIRQHATSLA